MESKVRLKNKTNRKLSFADLKDGEGVADRKGHLRLRISDQSYIHFSAEEETTGVDDRSNWPLDFGTDQPIRKFKLIAEEI